MALEIERKFLVEGDWPCPASGGVVIRQGYLDQGRSPGEELRVRLVTDPDGRRRAWLTSKIGHGLVRKETERPLPPAVAVLLLARPEVRALEKVRHRLPLPSGLVLEVDVYQGPLAGLVVAEVELPTADTPVALPAWVGREVTGDKAYGNHALAHAGLPGAWTDPKPSARPLPARGR